MARCSIPYTGVSILHIRCKRDRRVFYGNSEDPRDYLCYNCGHYLPVWGIINIFSRSSLLVKMNKNFDENLTLLPIKRLPYSKAAREKFIDEDLISMDRIRVSENKQVVLLIAAIYIVCILVFWPLMTVLIWSAAIAVALMSFHKRLSGIVKPSVSVTFITRLGSPRYPARAIGLVEYIVWQHRPYRDHGYFTGTAVLKIPNFLRSCQHSRKNRYPICPIHSSSCCCNRSCR